MTDQSKHEVSTLHGLCAEGSELNTSKFTLKLAIHGKPVIFDVDSGAAFTMVSTDTFQTVWPTPTSAVSQDDISLRTWSDGQLQVIRTVTVNVLHKNATRKLLLHVA